MDSPQGIGVTTLELHAEADAGLDRSAVLRASPLFSNAVMETC